MQIAAWNLHFLGSNKVRRVADAATNLDADILLFSEWKPTTPTDLGTVLADLGYPHQASAHWSHWDRRGRGGEFEPMKWGILAVSRTPVVDVSPEPPSHMPGSWLEVNAPDLGITVVGCRVLAHEPPAKKEKYAKDFAWMLEQTERLGDGMALLAGDLNARLDGPKPTAGLKAIVDSGWLDAVGALHGDAPPPSFYGKGVGKGRNDYCLISPKLAVGLVEADHPTEAGGHVLCGSGGISDHAPVVVTLDLARARSGTADRTGR